MGVYLAGAGQYPKDITDSVSQALATASKIQTLFANDELKQDPLVCMVDRDVCSGCGLCVPLCPYDAREVDPRIGLAVTVGVVKLLFNGAVDLEMHIIIAQSETGGGMLCETHRRRIVVGGRIVIDSGPDCVAHAGPTTSQAESV